MLWKRSSWSRTRWRIRSAPAPSNPTFNLFLSGLGAVELNRLDQFMGCMLVADLQSFYKQFRRKNGADTLKLLTQLKAKLSPLSGLPANMSTSSTCPAHSTP